MNLKSQFNWLSTADNSGYEHFLQICKLFQTLMIITDSRYVCLEYSPYSYLARGMSRGLAATTPTQINTVTIVWQGCGYPSKGVAAQIRCRAKICYKYEVGKLKQRKDHLHRERIGSALTESQYHDFWRKVTQLKSYRVGYKIVKAPL